MHHASILQLIAMKSTVTNYANDQEGTALDNSMHSKQSDSTDQVKEWAPSIHKTMGQQRKFIKQ